MNGCSESISNKPVYVQWIDLQTLADFAVLILGRARRAVS